ncbi:MAG: nuclear transport factor 2 family protein [Acidobacteriota bacterium]
MNVLKSISVFNRCLLWVKSEYRLFQFGLIAVLASLIVLTTSCSDSAKIEELSNRIGILEDTEAIRNLQHAYGYYIDKCLYEDVVDLFAENGEVHFFGSIYRGKEEGVRRLYVGNFLQGFTGGKPGPVYGFLLDHPQLQGVIHVAPDRKTAKGRFRSVMQAGFHESSPTAKAAIERGESPMVWWEGGIYENTYVREDGIWKFQVLNYNPLWHADYESGWGKTKMIYDVSTPPTLYPEDPTGPDAPMESPPAMWPNTSIEKRKQVSSGSSGVYLLRANPWRFSTRINTV